MKVEPAGSGFIFFHQFEAEAFESFVGCGVERIWFAEQFIQFEILKVVRQRQPHERGADALVSFFGAPEVEVHVCFLSEFDLIDVGVADGFVLEHPHDVEELFLVHWFCDVGVHHGNPVVERGEFALVDAHAFEKIGGCVEEIPDYEFGIFAFHFSDGNHWISQLFKYNPEELVAEGAVRE